MSWNIRRAILAAAGVAWAAALILHALLDFTYIDYQRAPNPEIGRTVSYGVKHVVVYITKDQRSFLGWLRWVLIGSGSVILISLILNYKWPQRSE